MLLEICRAYRTYRKSFKLKKVNSKQTKCQWAYNTSERVG